MLFLVLNQKNVKMRLKKELWLLLCEIFLVGKSPH